MLRRARWGLLALWLLLSGCAPARLPHATLAWQTSSEFNVAGFVIERGDAPVGPFERVSALIPSGDDPFVRHDYEYVDRTVAAGRTYYYQLVTIDNRNARVIAGRLAAEAN